LTTPHSYTLPDNTDPLNKVQLPLTRGSNSKFVWRCWPALQDDAR
jgi:hypothetical protein